MHDPTLGAYTLKELAACQAEIVTNKPWPNGLMQQEAYETVWWHFDDYTLHMLCAWA